MRVCRLRQVDRRICPPAGAHRESTPGRRGMPTASEALRRSLVGAHTLLAVRDGALRLAARSAAGARPRPRRCANLHTWPVLVGTEGSGDVVLSSPIILYDYPAIAPESPGDLCDGTEIDEILTLRIMTLTDDEKREARATDARARPHRRPRRHHSARDARAAARRGALAAPRRRSSRGAGAGDDGSAARRRRHPASAGWEEFLNPARRDAAGRGHARDRRRRSSARARGCGCGRRAAPTRWTSSSPAATPGWTGIYRDVEDACYVAVILVDDRNDDPDGRICTRSTVRRDSSTSIRDEIEPLRRTTRGADHELRRPRRRHRQHLPRRRRLRRRGGAPAGRRSRCRRACGSPTSASAASISPSSCWSTRTTRSILVDVSRLGAASRARST